MGTNTPLHHCRCWDLKLCTGNNLGGPFSFLTWWTWRSLIPKIRNGDLSDQMTLFHFASLYLTWPRVSWFGYVAYALHGRVSTCICKCCNDLCLLTRFSKVFLSPCSNIVPRIISVFNAVFSERLKVMSIHCWFLLVSVGFLLVSVLDFLRFSKSFDDIIVWTAHWETFLNSWTICPCSFSHKMVNPPSSLLVKDGAFCGCPFHAQLWSRYRRLLPINHFNCRVLPLYFRVSIYLQKSIKLMRYSIKYIVFVQLSFDLNA